MTSNLLSTSLLAFLLLFSSFSVPKKKTTIVLKHGSVLIYDIDANSEKFDLIVTLKKVKPEIVFSYETSGPSKKKGTITIPAAAIDSSRTLNNDFSGGNKTLNGELSLFLSRLIYGELAMAGMNEGGTSFRANPKDTMENFTRGEPNLNEIKVNGHNIQIDGERFYDFVNEKTGNYHYAFTVLKNEEFPLILDMNLGWILHLKQIDGVDVMKVEE